MASKSKSHAPTFTLFLDCVWQIYNQFPCSFEFTEKFLIFLADQAYCSNFGTFLCDNERERELLKVKEDTLSLWSYLNRPEILEPYINCLYDPNKNIIWPSVAPISLVSPILMWPKIVAFANLHFSLYICTEFVVGHVSQMGVGPFTVHIGL